MWVLVWASFSLGTVASFIGNFRCGCLYPIGAVFVSHYIVFCLIFGLGFRLILLFCRFNSMEIFVYSFLFLSFFYFVLFFYCCHVLLYSSMLFFLGLWILILFRIYFFRRISHYPSYGPERSVFFFCIRSMKSIHRTYWLRGTWS